MFNFLRETQTFGAHVHSLMYSGDLAFWEVWTPMSVSQYMQYDLLSLHTESTDLSVDTWHRCFNLVQAVSANFPCLLYKVFLFCDSVWDSIAPACIKSGS